MNLILKIAAGVIVGILGVALLYGMAVDAEREDLRDRLQTVADDAEGRLARMQATEVTDAEAPGDPVRLIADDENEVFLTLNVRRVMDPYRAVGEYETPSDGTRYVAVEMAVHNSAAAAYDEMIGLAVVTSTGTRAEEAITVTGKCRSDSSPGALSTNDTGTFCRVFTLPDGDTPSQIEASVSASAPGTLLATWPVEP